MSHLGRPSPGEFLVSICFHSIIRVKQCNAGKSGPRLICPAVEKYGLRVKIE